MRTELPVSGGAAFYQAPGRVEQIDFLALRPRTRIRYKSIGQITAALDYFLIVAACIVAGIGYHYLALGGGLPAVMQYVAAGNIVAALFVFGAAAHGIFNPLKIVSGRAQVRSVIFYWSVALVSFASFLFLAKTGPDFSRGTIIVFGALGLAILLVSHLWISAVVKDGLANGTIAGDRAITIGDSEAVLLLSQTNVLQKSGAWEIKRYLLPPLAGASYDEGLRLVDEAMQFVRSRQPRPSSTPVRHQRTLRITGTDPKEHRLPLCRLSPDSTFGGYCSTIRCWYHTEACSPGCRTPGAGQRRLHCPGGRHRGVGTAGFVESLLIRIAAKVVALGAAGDEPLVINTLIDAVLASVALADRTHRDCLVDAFERVVSANSLLARLAGRAFLQLALLAVVAQVTWGTPRLTVVAAS